jgi:glucose-1-phosphate adenylyltransferase
MIIGTPKTTAGTKAMDSVLSLILGGGRGRRLYPLTRFRSEPAVPLAGKYRLIDIPISNCINSGYRRIYVLTQFLSVSLHRHIAHTYKFDPFGGGFVEVLAAQQTNEAAEWYAGTADAVRQNRRYVEEAGGDDVLVLSADQVYRMDFRRLRHVHQESGADVTVAVLPVNREQVARVGVIRVDDAGRVTDLVEKPQRDEQLEPFRTADAWLERRGAAGRGRNYLANMGIYLFRRRALLDLLDAHPQAVDLVHEVFPRSLRSHHYHTHLFEGYWEDLGTIESYHRAHLALAGNEPPFDFHSPEGVIYTHMRFLPASQVGDATLSESLVSDGCRVGDGAHVERSVVGARSQIGRNVILREAVVVGADRYETEAERAARRRRGVPGFGVGDNSVIERAIVDKDARIGRDVRIVNRAGAREAQGDRYVIRDGIVVIPKGTVVPDGTVI